MGTPFRGPKIGHKAFAPSLERSKKLTYSKRSPGEECVFLPRALEVGLTFSLLILCMILLISFCTPAFFLSRTGWRLYVSVFHWPYKRYREW